MAFQPDSPMDIPEAGEASGAPESGDKFDSLLEERFARAHRRAMAYQIADFDRGRPTGDTFDLAHVRRKLRFHGAIPDKVKSALQEWVPDLLAHAAASGLRMRDLNHEIHFFDQSAFEDAVGPVPKGVKLPASSQSFNQLYRIYTVRVVLPPELRTVTQILTVLRAVLARLLGDIFLHEEIFTLEAYREEMEQREGEPSVGVREKILMLAESPALPPLLEEALIGHAKMIHVSYSRSPDQVRKAYFQETEKLLAQQKLPTEREGLIHHLFSLFLAELRGNLKNEITRMVEEVEKLNVQLNFLPPHELPDYIKLRASNPLHYLRSAHLRLNFLLEVLGAFGDLHEEMEQPDAVLSPLVEQALDGYLARMRAENLVRPYLIADTQLSEELERKKAAFPFEVHALMGRMPPSDNPQRAFKSLSNKLTNSIYQRLYTALLIIDAWSRQGEQGRGGEFRSSGRFQSLKGLLANFRFRTPLLEAMYIKIGVVLDVAETAGADKKNRRGGQRFPVEGFARAWSHLIPHVLITGYFTQKGNVKGFDPAHYWRSVEDSLKAQVAAKAGPYHLAYLLRQVHAAAEEDGIAVLMELLKNPSGTFRFTVNQALAPPVGEAAQSAEKRLEQLANWAQVVVQARQSSLKNAILPGQS
jgi:hypothetical protein